MKMPSDMESLEITGFEIDLREIWRFHVFTYQFFQTFKKVPVLLGVLDLGTSFWSLHIPHSVHTYGANVVLKFFTRDG